MLFKLVFACNIVLFIYFFFHFYLIIDLYFLIPPVLVQIFIPTEELAIPTWIPTKDAKAELEIHPVITHRH